MPSRSSAHQRWNNGKIISEHGYTKIRVGRNHPLADPNGYAYEHLVVWVSAGHSRPAPGYLLHHDNDIKSDNRLGNLVLKRRTRHSTDHQAAALSDDDVRSLRIDYAAGEHTGILADRYGIAKQRAWKLVRGMTRRTAGGPIHDAPIRKKRAGRLLDGRTWDEMPERQS